MYLGNSIDGVGIESPRCEIFKERARNRGREIELEGIVERSRGIGDDSLNVEVSGLDEVDGGDIVDRLAVLVDEEV